MTKQSNCRDLAQAITIAIGLPMAVHFKLITLGHKTGTKASAIHLMVANKDMTAAMEWLEQIYGKTQLKESATTFPLGQRLLLAPLASELNEKTWQGWTNYYRNKQHSAKKSPLQ